MQRRTGRLAAAGLAALALVLAGCGGDDGGDAGDAAETAAERLETAATPEQQQLLRDEARRVEQAIEDAVADLRDVGSLEDLEQRATDAADELEEARARIEALDLADEHEGARDQLVEAVETLERLVRELQASVADQDPVDALRSAGELSLRELQAAIERIERETGQ